MTALVLAAFVAGAFLLQQQAELPTSFGIAALIACAVVAALAAAFASRNSGGGARSIGLAAALLAAVAAGFLYAALRADLRLADQLSFDDEGRDVVVVGIVDSLPAQLERGQRFEFAVERVITAGVHVPARLALSWYGARVGVVPAERWQFTVRLRRPHGSVNPGGFDVEGWLLERNLRATGYVREGRVSSEQLAPQRLAAHTLDPGANVDRVRHHLRTLLAQRLAGERYGGVLIALVLGDQRAISEADWLLFNATGISHLVSISGLHITMIGGLAAWLTALLWRRSRALLARAPVQTAAAVAGMTAALAYCLLAGWGVPAQRTFFMLSVVAVAMLARTPLRPSLTLALAAAVVTLIDPWSSAAPGFWLSFGAVAAILLTMRGRRAPLVGWRARLRSAAQVQLAVTLALVPMTIALFQQVSVISPLANAVAIPLVSFVVTPLALLGGLFVLLPSPVDSLTVPSLAIGHAVLDVLAAVLRWAAGFGWSVLPLPAPPPWALLFALAGVLWLLSPRGWPLRWLGAVWLLPLFVWPPERPAAGELWVTALDVGQGAAVLLESSNRTVLYDTGPRYTPQADAGGRVILPYLRWRGIGRLDLLVVSHLDSDHSGGVASVLRAMPNTPVVTSIDPGHTMFAATSTVRRCTDQMELSPDVSSDPRATDVQLRFLHPTAADFTAARSTNAMSCVLLAQLGDVRVLLAGDIPSRQEAELLARESIGPVTLLGAPHHGSRHSSSEAFVEALRPRWIVFQAGYRNRFGHPDAGVLQRYRAVGSEIARTDYQGALQWRFRAAATSDAEPIAARSAGRRYWHNQPALQALTGVNAGLKDSEPALDGLDTVAPAAARDGVGDNGNSAMLLSPEATMMFDP